MRTTIDGERLLTQLHATGDSVQARLDLAGGGSCFLGPYSDTCAAPRAGTHTIHVFLYYGTGSASYGIGVESQDAPSKCVTLDPAGFAVNGPSSSGSLARGAAGDCYRFHGTAGMRLTVETTGKSAGDSGTADVRGWMENAAGERVCSIQSGHGTCELTGNGVHTVFLADMYGDAVTYTFRLVRMDVVTGCDSLAEAAFGSFGSGQLVSGDVIPYGGYDCYAVTLRSGFKEVRTSDGGQLDWELTGPAGTVCAEYTDNGRCEVAAGDYTLWLRNNGYWDVGYQAAIINLSTTQGCAAPVGTGWDQPAITIPAAPMVAYCQPFTAAPGERVVVYGGGTITDGSGDRICDQGYEQDGCLLPGTGPYRVLASGSTTEAGQLSLQIRRLSTPAGCPVVTPGAYGSAPAGAHAGNRCRSLSVPAGGRYLVRAVDDENYQLSGQIYDAKGERLCTPGYFCEFPAAGTYTLISGDSGVTDSPYATVFTAPGGTGCERIGDEGLAGNAYRGSFTTAGETDCLELDSPAGAKIGVLLPARASGLVHPGWRLINGAGEDLCQTSSCALTGPGPYRIVLSAPEDSAPGTYLLVVHRTDRISGCANLPLGEIGGTTGVTTAFSADRFAACWTIPAGAHATSEIVSYAAVAGTGAASMTVRDEAGRQVCGSAWISASQLLDCDFAAGKAYTVVLVASPGTVQYRVSRRDSSPTGANCRTPASTTLGAPGSAGTLTAPDDIHCFRVAATADTILWLGLRSDGSNAARYWIMDAAGKDLCAGFLHPCRVSGSTSYRVFVRPAKAGAVPYHFDAWNLGTPGKPAAQCRRAYGAPGFGPITGTLDDRRTAVCVAVPVSRRSEFSAVLTNTAGRADLPEPYYFRLGGPTDWTSPCGYSTGGRGCQVSILSGQTTDTALFVLAPKAIGANLPFQARTTCYYSPCSIAYVLGSVTPNNAANSGPVNLSLQGNGLTATDVVTLTRSGSAAVKAAVRSFADGVLTVTADLTDAAPGAWDVTVRPAKGGAQATIKGAVTVRATGLKLTKAPAISGTVRVGSTVRVVTGTWSPAATGYAYQWTSGGVAIKGATGSSYAIPAGQRGKRLGVTVTAKRANRLNSPAASAGVSVGWGVAPKATRLPTITGTAKAGKTLKVTVGAWSPSASSYRYEWRLNGKVVKGATGSTVKIQKSWKGKKVTVVVTAKRSGHHDGKATSKAVQIKR
ncbi:hypothetical protein [Actinoplanes sp. DH11]|uniref:hypothetical protein n=1 Tax=Actinoplanes sp. DH11 TaxID=2857011 RepID=UPI001E353103|nr:hypothetical protein [Actinoplanes sp. DH11]